MKALSLPFESSNRSIENTSGWVSAICSELFQHTDINGFAYVRIFDTQHISYLMSDVAWRDVYLARQQLFLPVFPKMNVGETHYLQLTKDTVLDPFDAMLEDFKNHLGIGDPFLMIERGDGYYDVYIFASNVMHNNMLNFYWNSLDLLKKFKYYFQDKGRTLINDAFEYKNKLANYCVKKAYLIKQYDKNLDFEIKQFILYISGKQVILTHREYFIAKEICRGFSAKVIAAGLKVSTSTVNFHISNICMKLNVGCKIQVATKLRSLTDF